MKYAFSVIVLITSIPLMMFLYVIVNEASDIYDWFKSTIKTTAGKVAFTVGFLYIAVLCTLIATSNF